MKLSREVALVPLVQPPNGDMRVSDLLAQLKTQQKFINDVVQVVSDLFNTHQQAQGKETR